MAGRHAFWLILDGDTPTSFRSVQRDDLVPTLVQLQRTQPAARLQWFERGQLWESPDAAKLALKMRRSQSSPGRGRDWRPGGAHKDPRERFKMTRDQKRARWKKGIGRKDKPGYSRPDREGTASDSKLNWKPAPRSNAEGGEKPKLNWKPASPTSGGNAAEKPKLNWKPASSTSGSNAGGKPKFNWKPARAGQNRSGFGSQRPGAGPRRQGFGPKKPRSRGPR